MKHSPIRNLQIDSDRLLDSLFKQTASWVLIVDQNQRIVYSNERVGQLLGISCQKILGRDFHSLIDLSRTVMPVFQEALLAHKREITLPFLRDPKESIMLSVRWDLFQHNFFLFIIEEAISSEIMRQKVHTTQRKALGALNNLMKMQDKRTELHQRRVANMAGLLADSFELSTNLKRDLVIAGFFHDLGKLGTDFVYNNPRQLTDEEWRKMVQHPVIGATLIQQILNGDSDSMVPDLILTHHEKLDGSGYPRSLTEAQLPFICRILTVADVFDAMTSERPHRLKIHSDDDALEELIKGCGKVFDAQVVEHFVQLHQRDPAALKQPIRSF